MSHSSNSKRKRLSKTDSNTPAQIDGLISPSSQDASGEDNDIFTTSSSSSQVPAKRLKNEATVKEQETDSNKVVSLINEPLPTIETENLSFPSPLSSPNHYSYKINPPPVGRPVRIYCDGIYDLFHYGHARSLEQAKKAFENVYLLVGVCDEKTTHMKKGKTVLDGSERAESLRHCKWVDEVVEHAPWVIDKKFMDEHQIDFVAHDNIPYASGDTADIYAFIKEEGKFLPTQRTEGVSTSDLITRIVRDYDQYVRRNLERGVSAKELNIGFLKEQELNVKKSISDIRSSIRQNWDGTRTELKNDFSELKNDLRQTFTVWEERSQELVRGFTGMFGVDSVVDKFFRRGTRRDSTGTANAEGDSSSGSGNNLSNNTSEQIVIRKRSFDFLRRRRESS